jgi:hypothetical protein
MKITKGATRPIIVIEMVSAWIAFHLIGVDPSTAFEATAAAAVGWYFADRTRTHIIGDKDVGA